jgi:hypothetical protein
MVGMMVGKKEDQEEDLVRRRGRSDLQCALSLSLFLSHTTFLLDCFFFFFFFFFLFLFFFFFFFRQQEEEYFELTQEEELEFPNLDLTNFDEQASKAMKSKVDEKKVQSFQKQLASAKEERNDLQGQVFHLTKKRKGAPAPTAEVEKDAEIAQLKKQLAAAKLAKSGEASLQAKLADMTAQMTTLSLQVRGGWHRKEDWRLAVIAVPRLSLSLSLSFSHTTSFHLFFRLVRRRLPVRPPSCRINDSSNRTRA